MKKGLLTVDPRGFVGGFAIWSLLMGASFAGPGEMLVLIPGFRVLRHFHIPEWSWGVAMLLVGGALLRTTFTGSEGFRVLASWAAGALWVLFGICAVWGGAIEGYFSVAGAFGVVGGAGCWLACQQWVWHNEP